MIAGTDPRLVFLLGSPRSGSTWLQSILAAHPLVATPPETGIIRSIAPLFERWDRHYADLLAIRSSLERGVPPERRLFGLPAVFDAGEIEQFAGDLVRQFARRVAEQKPGATVVLEKTPKHALHAGLIARVAPTARVIHLVRHPRAVVASILRAAQSWGQYWAPDDLDGAIDLWLTCVRAVHEAQMSSSFLTVRYEDLVAAPVETMSEIFDFCGVPRPGMDGEPHGLATIDDEFVVAGEARRLLAGLRYVEPAGYSVRGERAESTLTTAQLSRVDELTERERSWFGYTLD